jgi:hypothetical protein
VVSVSADAVAALRLLAGSADAWRTIGLPSRLYGEVRAIMNTYLSNLLGRRLKVATVAIKRGLLALILSASLPAAGCATLKMPTMPWAKKDAASSEKIAGELGEDADSAVISSEIGESDADLGWDYFKGENIKKRWKKMVGR